VQNFHILSAVRETSSQPPFPAIASNRAAARFSSDFSHIHHCWSTKWQCNSVRIKPGEYYVTASDEMLTTVLGSCIATCIRDPNTGIGGMNHFMLPISNGEQTGSWNSLRYGNYAMEMLINDILKGGGSRNSLEVKIFGGGKVLAKLSNIGSLNITFVREYLDMEELYLESEDLGDIYARKVIYFPANGKVLMKKSLITQQHHHIANAETDYLHDLDKHPPEGEIELFND
jgi:chemotaxis protein CheD